MLAAGDVDYTLAMPQALVANTDSAYPIRPLPRVVLTGSLAMVKVFVEEIHPKALSAALNLRTEFGFTVLHWACFFNRASIVELLLDRPLDQQCDTSATNRRGRTAWDLTEAVKAQAVVNVFEKFAGLDSAHPHASPALRKEQERRKRRPVVDETFRDDIELDLLRFTLWCVEEFDNWHRLAAGAFGEVYLVRCLLDIEVKGRRF